MLPDPLVLAYFACLWASHTMRVHIPASPTSSMMTDLAVLPFQKSRSTLACVYVIYKPRLAGVFHKYTTRVLGQRKFATDNPEPKGQRVYQWQISSDVRLGSYTCGIHHSSCGSYDIYYGDITLGCRGGYITSKTTYNYRKRGKIHWAKLLWFLQFLRVP